jgi:hypothetical protein
VLTLTPPVEPPTGLQKEWEVGLDGSSSAITIVHRLINRGPQAVEAAPWALTVVPGPGRAIVPQEPYVPHAQRLLPARTVTLWAYTDMRDSRYTWGTKFVQVRCDPAIGRSQKIGFMNTPGWMAYWREGNLLVKRMAFDPRATYPDLGANTEVYTGGDMLELETLGPLGKLEPGAKVEHVERWYLFKTQCGEDEAAMEKILLPLIQATEPVKP